MAHESNLVSTSPSLIARPPSAQRQPLPRNPSGSRTAPIPISSASSSRRQSLQLSTSSERFPEMPQRHSKPFTPAELHSELEREQEGIVNRLSRELQTLREHSSSIASTTSATSSHSQSQLPSAALQPPTPATTQPPDNPLSSPAIQSNNHLVSHSPFDSSHPINSPRIPTASRPHRSSSSSQSSTSRTQSMTSSVVAPSHVTGTASKASVDRARDAAGIPDPNAVSYLHSHPTSRSRAGSMRSSQPSPNLAAHVPSHAAPERRGSVQRAEEANSAKESLRKAEKEHDELVEKVKSLERELKGLGAADEARGRTNQRI